MPHGDRFSTRHISSAFFLILACTAWVLVALYLRGYAPRGDVGFLGFHMHAETVDGVLVRWTQSSSELEIPDGGWRPVHVYLRLRSPDDAPPQGTRVVLSVDEVPIRELRIGKNWEDYDVIVRQRSTVRGVLNLQIASETSGVSGRGVGVGEVRRTSVLVSRRGGAATGMGIIAGFLTWLMTGFGTTVRQHILRSLGAASAVILRPLLGERFSRLAPLRIYWRTASLVLLCFVIGLVPMVFDWNATAAVNILWFAFAFLCLTVFGRTIRLDIERLAGPTDFPLHGDPVFEFAVGLLSATVLLFCWSFLLKRVLQFDGSLGVATRWLFVLVLAVRVWFRYKRHPGSSPLLSRVDMTRIAAFLLFFSILAGPHFSALYGYSSDPEQHIAWTNQIDLHGYVPDFYQGTRLLIDYPLGFHALAYALVAPSGLWPATGVNVLPVLASALFIFFVISGAMMLTRVNSEAETKWQAVERYLLFFVLACVFSSSQFSVWHYYEGTGRLSAGLLHVVPVILLFGNVFEWARSRAGQPISESWTGPAVRLFALAAAGVLTFSINPAHLVVQLSLSLVALVFELLRPGTALRAFPVRAVTAAAAAGVLVAVVVILSEPYSYRSMSRKLPLAPIDDSHITHRLADYVQRFNTPSCLTLPCVWQATASTDLLFAFIAPLVSTTAGPIETVRSPRTPAFQTRWTFPDLTGFGLAPIHGIAPRVLLIVPLAFVLLMKKGFRAHWVIVAGVLLACCLDRLLRADLGRLVSLGDPTLRLIHHYSARASSIVFSQTFWPLLVCAIYASLKHGVRRQAWRALFLGVFVATLITVFISSWRDVGGELSRVAPVETVPSLADIRDLRHLETRAMPSTESYLVSSVAVFQNDYKELSPRDGSSALYLQSSRPTLFLYSQSYGARYSASDLEAVCDALQHGVRYPQVITDNRARWIAVRATETTSADILARQRPFCDRTTLQLFPNFARVDSEGSVSLYRLW